MEQPVDYPLKKERVRDKCCICGSECTCMVVRDMKNGLNFPVCGENCGKVVWERLAPHYKPKYRKWLILLAILLVAAWYVS